MFIEASFITAQTEKQYRGPSVGMVKQTVVHPHQAILLSNKEEQTTDTCSNLSKELC